MSAKHSRRTILAGLGGALGATAFSAAGWSKTFQKNGLMRDPYGAAKLFGHLPDGRAVHSVKLAWPGGMSLEVLDYGAIIKRMLVPAHDRLLNVVLGFETLDAYVADTTYQGGVVGRVANRIADATFTLDGMTYHVSANRKGNCLHGGDVGFNKRLWKFVSPRRTDVPAVTLAYHSTDLEEGFPGALDVTVTYALTGPASLTTLFEAQAHAPTPVNLSTHLYFNLSGDWNRSILDHELMLAADAITPVRDRLIPTGEIMPVAGTPFDFGTPKKISSALAGDHEQLVIAKGIDHNFVLREKATPALMLHSPESGLRLSMTTNQPGVQIYSGHNLKPPFIPHGALAIEPQNFPDAVNHPNFPNSILRPGATYRAEASYQFDVI